ncbi:MAG: peptidylprolyl isomerase [Candidatus Hydrogenedentes bacterium]|nr:peptidylprolyl isomerase [Candidatus Hydrogenedentota bacterium]
MAGEEAGEQPTYKVRFDCSCGSFVVAVYADWAPRGAQRFRELVEDEYFDDARFFRVIPGFMAQFGIAGDPAKTKRWAGKSIQDDPVKKSNTRGMVTFAKRGPNTRTTQLFINFADRNSYLDPQGFAPFGRVIEGMEAVDAINGQYADAPLHDTMQIMQEGNAFLDGKYPGLDYIKTARIVE